MAEHEARPPGPSSVHPVIHSFTPPTAVSDQGELFDPKFLSRLRALFFKLRKRRLLKKKGVQATPAAGFTREFKDHRHYVPGDDYRSIDWRLFARHERMFVRIFEEVQEFHIHILLDRSRSMAEPHGEKRITGLRLAIALAYLGLIGQHRVSVLTLSQDARREMPPLKGQGHVHALLKHLAGLAFEGVTDLVGSLRQFRPGRARAPSLCAGLASEPVTLRRSVGRSWTASASGAPTPARRAAPRSSRRGRLACPPSAVRRTRPTRARRKPHGGCGRRPSAAT